MKKGENHGALPVLSKYTLFKDFKCPIRTGFESQPAFTGLDVVHVSACKVPLEELNETLKQFIGAKSFL